jgi:hypothetical protein
MSNKLPALWTAEDDFTLVMTLAHQKLAGNAYKTGWTREAYQAIVHELEGSEKITGGATKTVSMVKSRWQRASDFPKLKRINLQYIL